jgi:hypothetical protein
LNITALKAIPLILFNNPNSLKVSCSDTEKMCRRISVMNKMRGLTRLFLVAAVTGLAIHTAHAADEFCENWATYMWDFQKQTEAQADSTWGELSAMNNRMNKGRRIAAVGQATQAEALPYPSIPSSVETELDASTASKVRTLYEKYVLLGRRIEDMWKDKFRDTTSPTSMQRFVSERDALIEEMNKASVAARAEFSRYGLRVKDCFPQYEALSRREVQTLNQALASANSALKVNDEVWTHAYPDETPDAGSIGQQQVSPRAPASVINGEPAAVPDVDVPAAKHTF